MPANLTAAYRQAEAAYKAAVTREEKLASLEEMLRVIPKHKGTEKLQADLRSRISKLKKEPAKKAGARSASHRIPGEGAGQIVLVGPPNAGKSALVARLTKAKPEVAEYPMTTREATPGMMPFGDIAFQLVDLPPLCDEYVDNWVYDVVRAADLAWIVLGIHDPLGGLETVERLLRKRAIQCEPAFLAGTDAAAGPAGDGGSGAESSAGHGAGHGAGSGGVAARGADAERRPGWRYLPALGVLTGLDRPGARDDVAVFTELAGGALPWVAVSTVTGEGLGVLGDRTFDALDIIRVYTKEPGHDPDMERPFTLPRGSTVEALARAIHGEIAEQLKYARIWGAGVFDGQRVRSDHPLTDGDIVELRT